MGRAKKLRVAELVEFYRSEFPTPYPVLVRVRSNMPNGWYGTTERIGRKLIINLDGRLRWSDLRETLAHEWAHAVTWRHESLERLETNEYHSDEWGLAYAKIYRATPDMPEAP